MKALHPKPLLPIAAGIIYFLFLFSTVSATILYVGPEETYDNIKWAISQAKDGDTIIVRDGVYVQDIKISKSLVLMAENKHGAVIGDGSDNVARISIARESVDGVIIDGFKIMDGGLAGIVVGDGNPAHAPRNCIIRNNHIQNRNRGIRVDATSTNLEISGNTITGCVNNAINHMGTGENIIANNVLANCGLTGILLPEQHTGSFIISGNAISNNSEAGIAIERSDIVIKGNIIEENRVGIITNCGRQNIVIADSNQVINNTEIGIEIECETRVTIKGNIISGNGDEGIIMRGIATIDSNTIKSNGRWGINVPNGSATISNNQISKNIIHGIEIQREAGYVAVLDNSITNNEMIGIMSSSQVAIKGNFINGNRDHGILIADSTINVQITHQNTISNNDGHEILISREAVALIKDNTIESNWNGIDGGGDFSGIEIGGKARLERNIIQNIDGAGIFVNETAKDVVIINQNRIRENLEGIIITGSARVENNIISDNLGRGIRVLTPAKGVNLSWNSVYGNYLGIAVLSEVKGVSILNNNVSENIRGVFSAGESRLRSNTIQKNTEYGIKIRNASIDLGDPAEADSGLNAILDNGEWNMINGTGDTIIAFCNYWGMNDADSIDATISDDNEDSASGPVIFEPFLMDHNVGIKEAILPGIEEDQPGPMQVYPNPFNHIATIKFRLSAPRRVHLKVIDITGGIVKTIVAGRNLPAGQHSAEWDGCTEEGKRLAGGIYLMHLQTSKGECVSRILLAR